MYGGDEPVNLVLTISVELDDSALGVVIINTADHRASAHRPPRRGAVFRVLDDQWRPSTGLLLDILAVVAQAVLGDLYGVEVTLLTPLVGQRHTYYSATADARY